MSTQTAPLGLRLVMEGVEVPVISAQVSALPGQPAAAAIQIVPLDSAQLLLPRTLVHLFYLDNKFDDRSSTLGEQVSRGRDERGQFQVADTQYRTLFIGEVVATDYSKTPSSRSMVLQCLDLSSYWDTCYQWFADFSVNGDGLTDRSHNFTAAGEYLFNNVASGTTWVVGDILTTKPENPDYARTEGLLAGYIHLIETIGGLRPRKGNTYKSFRGVNDFFTVAELKYNLSGMLGAIASDKTSAQMFAHKAFINWLQNGMASVGSLVSYRDILALVGQYIFHEVYPNPAPFYVKGGSKITQRVASSVADSASATGVNQLVQSFKTKVEEVLSSIRHSVEEGLIPYTIQYVPSGGKLQIALKHLDQAFELVSQSGSRNASQVNNLILLASAEVKSAVVVINGSRTAEEVFLPLHVYDRLVVLLESAIRHATRAVQTASLKRKVEENVEVTTGDHLFNQLILPEAFFVVPPRCNVLFPDMYFSLSYSRHFLREITRLSCQGGLGILTGGGQNDTLLGSQYFAPAVRDVNNKIARKTIFNSGSTIMPHEIHAGIIPKFEWVTDGHRWGVEAARTTLQNVQSQKVDYIQRLANFQFFIHRWAARTMNIQGRFNPHLVLGFPGVVVDRYDPSVGALFAAGAQAEQSHPVLPIAYIGKVANYQHTVGQDGGVTSVAYTQARTHRGLDDEFLGVLSTEQKGSAKSTVTAAVEPILNELRRSKDPGTIIANYAQQLLLIQTYAQGRLQIGLSTIYGRVKTLDGLDGSKFEVTEDDFVKLGLSLDDFQNLQLRQGLVTDPTKVGVPAEIKVTFDQTSDRGKFVRREGSAPFEELVRPGYYARDVWDNANITAKVYLPLLGTRAITDDDQVGDPEQFAELVKSSLIDAAQITGAVEVVTEGSAVVLKVAGVTVATVGFNITTGTTTETAVDGLVLMYGILKKRGLDIQSFIDDYTSRPIANMIEILGDPDLQFDANGDVKPRADGSIPVEGFHSRAFGPYNVDVKQRVDTGDGNTQPVAGTDAFLGLIPLDKREEFAKAPTIIRKSVVRNIPIPLHLDPRGRAHARVVMYADELKSTRGISAS